MVNEYLKDLGIFEETSRYAKLRLSPDSNSIERRRLIARSPMKANSLKLFKIKSLSMKETLPIIEDIHEEDSRHAAKTPKQFERSTKIGISDTGGQKARDIWNHIPEEESESSPLLKLSSGKPTDNHSTVREDF